MMTEILFLVEREYSDIDRAFSAQALFSTDERAMQYCET